jgi:MFS family permease
MTSTQPAQSNTGFKSNAGFWPVFRVASGNFLEMYDFMVFGYYAEAIGAAFFPQKDDFTRLMLTFMTFGAGFLMRPLGAVILGAYADKHGRRAGLLLTLGLMAVGVLTLALTPDYKTIGLAAPLIVLAGRLLQGFSAGMELGGVSVYLSEIAPPGRKGFYVAWQSASQQVAVVVAAIIGLMLNRALGHAAMNAWGWRIPLLIGCLIVPVLFYMRRSMQETEAFSKQTHRPELAEVWRSLVSHAPTVLVGMMLVIMTTVSFYMITNYTPTFGTVVLHMSPVAAFTVTLCVGLSNLILLPVMGAVSDRVGRKPLLYICTVLMLLTAYPAMRWLVAAPSFGAFLAVELWLAVLYASYNGAMVVFLTEIVPLKLRAAGFSLAYSLATAFGGFSSAIATWLIKHTGDKAMPGAWLSFAAVMGLGATLLARKHQEKDLRQD